MGQDRPRRCWNGRKFSGHLRLFLLFHTSAPNPVLCVRVCVYVCVCVHDAIDCLYVEYGMVAVVPVPDVYIVSLSPPLALSLTHSHTHKHAHEYC